MLLRNREGEMESTGGQMLLKKADAGENKQEAF